jgi:hypothetical protein
LWVALILAVVLASGCGSSEPDETTGRQRLLPWLKGPTREFLIRDGNNSTQILGREATKTEREQASRVIQAWMKAGASQNWGDACSYFSRKFIHRLVATDAEQASDGRVTTCPQALAYFGHAASGSYKNNLAGPIDSLRVIEDRGYAQYHGNDGHDWIINLEREGGKWLVALATTLPRSI